MADEIRIRAQLRGGLTEVQLLLVHPMETGLRKDEHGAPVAQHYITEVDVSLAGRSVLHAAFGRSVSRDPLLRFRFRGGGAGEWITARWRDTQGRTLSHSVPILEA